MSGPVPKRDSERRRRNKPTVATSSHAMVGAVPVPEPDEAWHPIARDWFVSLAGSGQSRFYEPSDWATARFVAEAMTRNLAGGARFSAQLFAAVMSAMTELLTTEGARRRARLEIERSSDEAETPAGVTALEEYRTALGGG